MDSDITTRASNYNIYIKVPESEDYLFLHGYTGAMDSVSKSVYERILNEEFESISEDVIKHLINRGYITNKTVDEERCRVALIAAKLAKMENREQNYGFIITYDCNFRCPYCFESMISNAGDSWTKEVFNKELVDAAFRSIDNFSSDNKKKSIMLYGGEPLLVRNKPIVEYIVDRGIKRGFKFNAITNGYEIDSFKELLGSNSIDLLQITIDGKENTHNSKRTHYLGKTTFSKILNNIELAIFLKVKVSLRLNIDNQNLDEIETILGIVEQIRIIKTTQRILNRLVKWLNYHMN